MSGNPVPQHNPTDGLNVAAQVVITGSDASATGSAPVTVVSGREYTMILSKSNVGYDTFVNLTVAVEDIKGGVYDVQGVLTVSNPNNPSAGSPTWYKPSNFAGYSNDVFSASVASNTATGGTVLVTALNVGHGTLEINFPTFDNTEAAPAEKIYCKVDITVVP
jgi:hypothetical protein